MAHRFSYNKAMRCFAIMRDFETLEISGSDAKDFLNRLTTIDFRALKPGHFSAGFFLQATGKIILYFEAVPLAQAQTQDQDRFLFIIPAGTSSTPAQTAFEALEKVHFMEQLTITPMGRENPAFIRIIADDEAALEPLSAIFGITAPELASMQKGEFRTLSDGRVLLNFGRWLSPAVRYDFAVLIARQDLSRLQQDLTKAGLNEFDDIEPYRILAGDPAVPNELNPQSIPLEAGMHHALHENKGCYPGQEVIERIRAMGQVARYLFHLEGDGAPPERGTAIQTENGDNAGVLTSVARHPEGRGWIGLGYVKRLFANPTPPSTIRFMIGGQPVRHQKAT